jgi:CRISPR system Cascade subunit CasD
MNRWLVVTLAAPLASFGEAAGNSERGTADRPTRSALLGLAGAALGILRDDDKGNQQLTSSFSTSTRTINHGRLMKDFHTYQSVEQSKGRFSTRAKALAAVDPVTSITQREYRCDGHWQAAYRMKPDAALTLEDLKVAFLTPHFTLFLGRKSCPLAHPLDPKLMEAVNLAGAFEAHTPIAVGYGKALLIATDERSDLIGINLSQNHRRLDEPRDRKTWQFSARDEWTYAASRTAEKATS